MGQVRLFCMAALIAVAAGTADATWQTFDDFDRPNASNAGPEWTTRLGAMAINSGRVVNPGSNNAVITHNSFPTPIDPQEIRFDVFHSQTTAVQYAAAILGYNPANGNHLAIRVQSNGTPFTVYTRVYFYLYNASSSSYQVWSGMTDGLPEHPEYDTIHNFQYFPTAELTASYNPSQGRVTLTIGENDVYTRGGINATTLGLGSLVGLGLMGPSAIDDFQGNVIPEPAGFVLAVVAGIPLLLRRRSR